MSSIGASENGTALIVQGVLIFLSAVVGVFGFMVKGRIERKAKNREDHLQYKQHLRRTRLERTRQQISDFVGPASQHSMAIWSQFWNSTLVGDHDFTLDKLSHGEVNKYFKEIGFSFQSFITAKTNAMCSWVGPKVEQMMRDEPDGDLAVVYRDLMRRIVLQSAVPLSRLIEQYGQVLSQFPTTEEFKERFPCSASDGWLRNSYYNSFINWTHEFVEIIKAWDRGDYKFMFPVQSIYPAQLTPYLISQLTKLRTSEMDFGSADHKVAQDKDFDKRYESTEYVKNED